MASFFRILLAVLMVFAGAMHFVAPKAYVRIMPKSLPAPLALVWISGVCEIALGAGLLVPATQRLAAWGLIALFIAVFPANVNMAMNRIPLGRLPPKPALLWGRLPLQLVLIAWAWHFT